MLKKINRLSLDRDFDNVWEKGRSSFDKVCGLKAAANGLKLNRFGVVVGAKTSPKAVERNKLKRWVRAILAEESSKLKQGFDIVAIVLPPGRQKVLSEIKDSLLGGFKKLRLYQ